MDRPDFSYTRRRLRLIGFVVVAAPCVVAAALVSRCIDRVQADPNSYDKRKQRCESSGGVWFAPRDGSICIRREAVIDVHVALPGKSL